MTIGLVNNFMEGLNILGDPENLKLSTTPSVITVTNKNWRDYSKSERKQLRDLGWEGTPIYDEDGTVRRGDPMFVTI